MSYINVGKRLGKYGNKAISGRDKLVEALKPWVCCNRPRHNNKSYRDLEKFTDSSGVYNQTEKSLPHKIKLRLTTRTPVAYSISNPIAVEVNGKAGDIGQPRTISVQELPASPVPKRLDGSFDPTLPALSMNLYDTNNERRRTFDFFHYQPPSQNRITQIIDSYGDYGAGASGAVKEAPPVPIRPPSVMLKMDDERLRNEIEFIRAASRKYPENSDLSAAADATYLVDEKGEPRPEMVEAIDRVLGGSARERGYLSGSTEMSNYTNTSNLIQPLRPKPAQLRDSDQPRQLLRSMDERKQLEQRLLNIQRALSQRKKDKQGGQTDSVPPHASTQHSTLWRDFL